MVKTVTNTKKHTIQMWLAFALAVFGVLLIVLSFVVPPLGVIHTSVLAAIGEVFTFSGSIMGIDYTYKYKLHANSLERN